jgi:hypothetical protein
MVALCEFKITLGRFVLLPREQHIIHHQDIILMSYFVMT